jgi:hypothetical protein
MSDDSRFRIITGGDTSSEETREPDHELSLELLKGFVLLNRKDQMKVIHLVSQLTSSSRRTDT